MNENLKILGLRKITNGYLASGDVYYENLEIALCAGILGFSEYGDPLAVVRYVSGALQILKDSPDNLDDNAWLDYEEKITKYFSRKQGADYLMWCVLDKAKLTDGNTIPGRVNNAGSVFVELEKSIPIQEYETEM